MAFDANSEITPRRSDQVLGFAGLPTARTVHEVKTRLVVAVAVVFAAGACSSSSDGDRGSDTPTTTAATIARAPLPDRFTSYESTSYGDPSRWICRPDVDDDPCDGDLDAEAIAADGTTEPVPFERADDPGVDCFYVYPTVSADPTTMSDWEPGPEEVLTTEMQAVRLQASCRLFVPAYRQLTRAGLLGRGTGAGDVQLAYADVEDAFRTYLAQDNGGRGFVLVGHSQGSLWLTQLLAEVVEPDDALRERLVGSYLPGTAIEVEPGETVGGTFERVPLCTEAREVGCVTTWSSWDAGGGPDAAPEDGLAPACVHPGTVGGEATELSPAYPSGMGGLVGGWTDDGTPVEAPWAITPGIATARCTDGPTQGHLSVTMAADPDDARTDELPLYALRGADLHLIDVNLAGTQLSASLAAQVDAYLAGR